MVGTCLKGTNLAAEFSLQSAEVGPHQIMDSDFVKENCDAATQSVFRHTTQLLRDALRPENRSANGLTNSSVAALLAELWFPPLAPGFGAAGQPRSASRAPFQGPTAPAITLGPEPSLPAGPRMSPALHDAF